MGRVHKLLQRTLNLFWSASRSKETKPHDCSLQFAMSRSYIFSTLKIACKKLLRFVTCARNYKNRSAACPLSLTKGKFIDMWYIWGDVHDNEIVFSTFLFYSYLFGSFASHSFRDSLTCKRRQVWAVIPFWISISGNTLRKDRAKFSNNLPNRYKVYTVRRAKFLSVAPKR